MGTQDRAAMKKILVSNDDGIRAPGLLAVAKALNETNRYEIRVAAPEEEQSAKSHSITLRGTLTVRRYELPGELVDIPAYMVTGTPADCVKVALNTQLCEGWRPDLVISGINRGLNTGLNVHYSGTVAAAREANICSIPAIAASMDCRQHCNDGYFALGRALVELVDAVFQDMGEHGDEWARTILNVNAPNPTKGETRGWKLTQQGRAIFKDDYSPHSEEKDEEGNIILRRFSIHGAYEVNETDVAMDSAAVQEGYYSVTPLPLQYLRTPALGLENWPLFQANK